MTRSIDYAALGLQLVAEECRNSLFYFVKTFWDVIIKEKPVYNWHIPYLCEELQKLAQYVKAREPKPYDLIINIPPGTTKSTIVTIMFPVWLWVIDPTLQIITNSYSGGLSIEHAIKSKDIITSDKFRRLFPDIIIRRDKSGKQHYANTAGGFRYATSTGATITGFHAHIIINDDPVNPKQADSEQLRLNANEHTKTLSSRKVDKANTPTITVMQRLHINDVTGYQLKDKSDTIRHICLPAELAPNIAPAELAENYIDGLLDPIRLNRAVLKEAMIDLGSVQYSGQYMQSPVVDGGNIVKQDWFRRIPFAEFKALRFREPMHFYLDTAYSKKKAGSDNDPSGILAACRIGNNIYLYDAQKAYKEMPDLLKFLPEYAAAHCYSDESILHVEPKANGESVVQMLEKYSKLNVKRTPSPTDDKVVRLKAVSPRIECGRVYMVEGSWNEEFLTEVCGFPNAPHDEYVDILGYAINDLLEDDDDFDYDSLSKSMFGL
ncbi:MAG: phage terminase large subunit [Bacteroidales bacterium]|nr:phage terminase large subunit [Bacteroidales bacterium]